MDPSPRCVTWGLLFLTVGTPSSLEIFVVRDVDVDESIFLISCDTQICPTKRRTSPEGGTRGIVRDVQLVPEGTADNL